MKKIIYLCVIIGLVFSFPGASFSGSGKEHQKSKEHKGEYSKKKGPPPHAPAHGYRYKHSDGVDLEFNPDRGIYIVVGYEDHYFHGEFFYRVIDGGWKKCNHISGPWVDAPTNTLPTGLPPLPPPPMPKHNFWNIFSTKD